MIERGGYFKLLEVRGIPLFIHWSLPLGGLLISALFGFDRQQTIYYVGAYLALILFHELGHLVATRASGLKVYALYISGFGGECRLQVPNSTSEAFRIYAAGLTVQLILFIGAVIYLALSEAHYSTFTRCMLNTLLFVNAFMFFSNLVPHVSKAGRANDGHVLWGLIKHACGIGPFPLAASPAASRVFPEHTQLLLIKELIPPGFTTGIEILNDNTTPMELVVSTLKAHLGLSQDEAIALMIAIHSKGGVLISMPPDKAAQIAQGITDEARKHGHNLICRAVDAQQSVSQPTVIVGSTGG